MFKHLLHRTTRHLEHRALVLMYHRVAKLPSDIWGLAVSPDRFEEQLKVLRRTGAVVSLQELVERVRTNTLARRTIAISFDDGYADNLLAAKPLLEHYQLPATFFITSGHIGLENEFWWDELEQLLLFSEHLPSHFLLHTEERSLEADLTQESRLNRTLLRKHSCWQAGVAPPPSARAHLYYAIWQQMKPLACAQQQLILAKIRAWAQIPCRPRPAYQSLSVEQLRALSASQLFTIGAHTLTHPSLSNFLLPFQRHELQDSKLQLEKLLNRSINLLSYPYGEASKATEELAQDVAYQAAFTTAEQTLENGSPPFRLGRFQVYNWGSADFERHLKHWFTYC